MKAEKYEAILLDLDGTLINLDLNQFITAYVGLLAEKFTDFMGSETFAGHLFASTEVMVKNSDGLLTNRDVFYEDFCRRTGCELETIEPRIDEFYQNDYPALKRYSQPLPVAKTIAELLLEKNVPVVLATNPIFPPEAVEQRVFWGKLQTEHFDLITTMNNMHYCKPNPDYYSEIAEMIGVRPEKCLMAGNDAQEDLAAAKAGMETFLVDDFLLNRTGAEPQSHYRGRLTDLLQFIQQI